LVFSGYDFEKSKNDDLLKVKSRKIRLSDEKIFLKTLSLLWEKGLKPRDLKKHFLLTWFVFSNGIVLHQARYMHVKRIRLYLMFRREALSGMVGLRKVWLKINEGSVNKSGFSKFFIFYKKIAKYPILSSTENSNLMKLWLWGFPERLLRVHYVLWSIRSGMKMTEIGQRLEIVTRVIHRIRSDGFEQKNLINIWFGSMNLKEKDWYPKLKMRRSISRKRRRRDKN
jgi:hypothetical protein